jgi:hypothetical protein
MTRVSEINIADETKRIAVETTTDATRLIYNEYQREQYIAEFGDVVVEYDEYYKKYTVSAHKVERDAYIASKAKYCMQYGSE